MTVGVWEPAVGGFMVVVVSALGTKPTTKIFFFHDKIPKIIGTLVV